MFSCFRNLKWIVAFLLRVKKKKNICKSEERKAKQLRKYLTQNNWKSQTVLNCSDVETEKKFELEEITELEWGVNYEEELSVRKKSRKLLVKQLKQKQRIDQGFFVNDLYKISKEISNLDSIMRKLKAKIASQKIELEVELVSTSVPANSSKIKKASVSDSVTVHSVPVELTSSPISTSRSRSPGAESLTGRTFLGPELKVKRECYLF